LLPAPARGTAARRNSFIPRRGGRVGGTARHNQRSDAADEIGNSLWTCIW